MIAVTRKCALLTLGVLALACLPAAAQQATPPSGQPDAKPPASRKLKVKLNYTGTGKVDEKHKIHLFLFDSPDFASGGSMPTGSASASAKDETVTFSDTAETVYVVATYDPSGSYDGMSGPPPSGSSMGMYTKTGQPEPIKIEAGKTAEVVLAFDDSNKMP